MDKKTADPLTSEAELRKDIRLATELERMVYGHDETDGPWKEITTVLNISRSGAGFTLSRPCVVGRLVRLTVPMASDLHALADPDSPASAVGLVQYCHASEAAKGVSYHVGVAFVGEKFPTSHLDDPGQSYRITGRDESGMWSITEADSEFTSRTAPRFGVHLDVTVSLLKRYRRTVRYKEDTITYNVSLNGACVACGLAVEIDDRVKFASKQHNFYSLAVVRNRSRRMGRPAVHLEFLDDKYPVEKLPPTSAKYPDDHPDKPAEDDSADQ